jgi:hypothetical protein
MTLQGTVVNGAIVLDGSPTLPEGARVWVELETEDELDDVVPPPPTTETYEEHLTSLRQLIEESKAGIGGITLAEAIAELDVDLNRLRDENPEGAAGERPSQATVLNGAIMLDDSTAWVEGARVWVWLEDDDDLGDLAPPPSTETYEEHLANLRQSIEETKAGVGGVEAREFLKELASQHNLPLIVGKETVEDRR